MCTEESCIDFAKGAMEIDDVVPVDNQGSNSLTLISPSLRTIIQFRLKPFRTDRHPSLSKSAPDIIHRLSENVSLKELAPDLFRLITETLQPRLSLLGSLPAVLTHHDFAQINILVDDSGHLTGVIDFDEAGVEAFGMCIWGLYECFFGSMEDGKWSFYDIPAGSMLHGEQTVRQVLERSFWESLCMTFRLQNNDYSRLTRLEEEQIHEYDATTDAQGRNHATVILGQWLTEKLRRFVLGEWEHNTSHTDGEAEISNVPSCVCCLDEIQSRAWITLSSCEHEWCQECLERNFEQAMRSRASWPPRCCDKFTEHDLEQVEHLISEELSEKWKAKNEELSAHNPTYCPRTKCQAFIPAHGNDQFAICESVVDLTISITDADAHEDDEDAAGSDTETFLRLRALM
ncbi:hypothetical protein DV738_g328, partial [Chaetothyriales sp. CBS 135597]